MNTTRSKVNNRSGSFLRVRPDRCMGCHTCEVVCAVAHSGSGDLPAAMAAGEILSPRNRVVEVGATRFVAQCQQCEDAPCVRVCPTGATYRTETYTAVDSRLCIACKLCMIVCPFGAVHIGTVRINGHSKPAAVKCDLCVDRAGGPACLAACPTRVLSLATPQAVMNEAIQDSAKRYLAAIQAQGQAVTTVNSTVKGVLP